MIGDLTGEVGFHTGDHVCWTYGSDQEHREVLTRFLAQGLRRRERVMYLGHRYEEDTVLGYLREAGVADEQFRHLGQLVIEDIHRAVLGEGGFESERSARTFQQAAAQAVVDGYRGLRVAGESASLVPELVSVPCPGRARTLGDTHGDECSAHRTLRVRRPLL